MLLATCVTGMAIAWFHRSPTTVRHNLGNVGAVSMGIIAYGDRVDVLAKKRNGELEKIAENVMVAFEARGDYENDEFVIYIDVYASIWQKYRIQKYKDVIVELRLEDD
jgi:hypothetical protein